MVNLVDLPSSILSSIAREVVEEHQQHEDVLDLLGLRLLFRRFNPSLIQWIFHTAKILADLPLQAVMIDHALYSYSKYQYYIPKMAVAAFRDSVRHLSFYSFRTPMQRYAPLFHMTGKTITRLHLAGVPWGSPATTSTPSTYLPKTFDNLQTLILHVSALPILPNLLQNAPSLHSLCLEGSPYFVAGHLAYWPTLASHCKIAPGLPPLKVLRITQANEYRLLGFLQACGLRARRVQLGIQNETPRGLLHRPEVVTGTRTWPIFSVCEEITLLAEQAEDWNVYSFQDLCDQSRVPVVCRLLRRTE
jgi:hypothetical protein